MYWSRLSHCIRHNDKKSQGENASFADFCLHLWKSVDPAVGVKNYLEKSILPVLHCLRHCSYLASWGPVEEFEFSMLSEDRTEFFKYRDVLWVLFSANLSRGLHSVLSPTQGIVEDGKGRTSQSDSSLLPVTFHQVITSAQPSEHTAVVLVVSVCLMSQTFLLVILPEDSITEKLLVEINTVYIAFYL